MEFTTLTQNLMLSAFFACVLLAIDPLLGVAFCALVGGQILAINTSDLYAVMVVFFIVGGGVTIIKSFTQKTKDGVR